MNRTPQKDPRKATNRIGRRPIIGSDEYTPYDLSIPMRDLDGSPITPLMLNIMPTETERLTAEERSGEDPIPGRVRLQDLPTSYTEEPCPLWRCLRTQLVTPKVTKFDKEGKPAEYEKLTSAEKSNRYSLAHDLMSHVRKGKISVMPLSVDDRARLRTVCEDLSIEHRGVVYDALTEPDPVVEEPTEEIRGEPVPTE